MSAGTGAGTGKDHHPARSLNASFVYPVKSLLTGNILPAGPTPSAPKHPSSLDDSDNCNSATLSKSQDLHVGLPPEHQAIPRLRKPKARGAGRVPSPNFRHYPGEDAPTPSFATVPVPLSTTIAVSPLSASPTGDSGNISDPDSPGLHNDTTGTSSPPPELDPRHPANFTEVTSGVFSGSAANFEFYPHVYRPQLATHVNISDTSIVHLPPSHHASDPYPTRYSSSSSSQQAWSAPQSQCDSLPSSHERCVDGIGTSPAVDLEGSVVSRQSVRSDDSAHGTGRSGGSSGGYPPGDDLVTFRFEHREDGDGHHVVIGREGMLSRCEDEPIRTPGAVQGFGVLIAVQEDIKNDRLLVRQVSENSTELLGLSPRYLFSLTSFTDVLPDSQASILWDNIQYLADPDEDSPSEDDSPHIFLLSGWGMPGSALLDDGDGDPQRRRLWSCWCAAHLPKMTGGATASGIRDLVILEFELEHDKFNPLYPAPPPSQNVSDSTLSPFSPPEGALMPSSVSSLATQTNARPVAGLEGDDNWTPSAEDILESTTNYAKPLPALERIRNLSRIAQPSSATGPGVDALAAASDGSGCGSPVRTRRRKTGAVGLMDVFAVISQINEQLSAAPDLDTFLKFVVGLIKDLTQFHRVLVYQFDENWNGQTVAELVDWNHTHDLYRGLHFPASDIPAQVGREYKIRLLYDREQPTARLIIRSKDDLEVPLNMTHCYLRAMSPIHLKYLANMGVRSSMSVSIVAFGHLWGLVACHSYGLNGMRVSFPVRQILRLMSDSISRNVERLSYAQRLLTRKLFNAIAASAKQQPQSYIVSNADDLLGLFNADFGVLVIGEGAKILGPNEHGQEVLVVAEYLRLKHFSTIQASQAVTKDFPDLQLSTGLEVIAGLLFVPLSQSGSDFIVLLRKGLPRAVRWAGRPYKDGADGSRASLEPRASFRVWSETVAGRCRAWSEEQLETAGVLALVYGKFIEVWRGREREKDNSLQMTKLTNILLSNAGHEVRTPLNHIINCLELALNGKLDIETRENLSKSHAASKSLLFTINDLLNLTRVESGHEMTFHEPFDLPSVIMEATDLYKHEAKRNGLDFELNLAGDPRMVIGDSSKVRTVVANLTANALRYTQHGTITVSCRASNEPEGLRNSKQVAVEIIVSDTGCGIPTNELENIFREFEQVESAQPKTSAAPGLGLGLAVVARSVEQLGGQLRVESKVEQGSRFSFIMPFTLWDECEMGQHGGQGTGALVSSPPSSSIASVDLSIEHEDRVPVQGVVPLMSVTPGSQTTPAPEAVKVGKDSVDTKPMAQSSLKQRTVHTMNREGTASPTRSPVQGSGTKLRILSVEDNDINRLILAKRLQLDGHTVVNTTNGKEGVEMIEGDQAFDCVLMDIQMPILNGLEATRRIRQLEATKLPKMDRHSHLLNGGRIPIFAVSASLVERQHEELKRIGIDGWILKPIDFRRLYTILRGVMDPEQRSRDEYRIGRSWEIGGWLLRPSPLPPSVSAHTPSTDHDGADLPTAAAAR
ncbi:hypothetical protein BJV74DRAFT_927090 [Russula compacta]|nr:hypothetical protein BJV74DRAFT_927090 [Russula compacta]